MPALQRSPRVVHIVPAFFRKEGGTLGGAERYALELAKAMSRRVPTSLFSFGTEAERFKIDDLDVRVFRTAMHVRAKEGNPLAPGFLPRLREFDVVHTHQFHMIYSSLAAAAGRLMGRRVFATGHGGGAWDISGYVSTDRWYNGILYVSQYSRLQGNSADSRRHHVIMGGVDVDRFTPDPTVPRGDGPLFVGRLLPHKGVIDLVDAVGPDMPLTLLGQPYHERYMQDLVAAAEGKNVIFRHGCNDADLIDAYRRAMVVVLPSVYTDRYGNYGKIPELLGQTLLEGMACGTPAICTDVASMPEVVEHGVTGFVVPPNDPAALGEKLRWLRDHKDEAARMGENARRRVLDLFTWDRVVDRCLDIYNAGTARASRPAADPAPAQATT